MAVSRSDGEDVGEGVGEDAEDEEPGANHDEHGAAPSLDARRTRLQPGDGAFLGPGDQDREGEHERHDDDCGRDEGAEGGGEAAGAECMSGQTGQDGARSAKAGQQVEEPERGVSGHRVSPAEAGL